jgi:hypothetical protein
MGDLRKAGLPDQQPSAGQCHGDVMLMRGGPWLLSLAVFMFLESCLQVPDSVIASCTLRTQVSGVSLVSVLTMPRSKFVAKYPAAANLLPANAQGASAQVAAGRAARQHAQGPLQATPHAAVRVNGVSTSLSRPATNRLFARPVPAVGAGSQRQEGSSYRGSTAQQGQGQVLPAPAGSAADPIVLFPPSEQHMMAGSHAGSSVQVPLNGASMRMPSNGATAAAGSRRSPLASQVAQHVFPANHQQVQGLPMQQQQQQQLHSGMGSTLSQQEQGQEQGLQPEQQQRRPGRRRRREPVQSADSLLPSQLQGMQADAPSPVSSAWAGDPQQQGMQADASMTLNSGQATDQAPAAVQPVVNGSSAHVLEEGGTVHTVMGDTGAVPLVHSLSLQPSHLVDDPVHVSWSDQQLQQDLQAALLEQQSVLNHNVVLAETMAAMGGAAEQRQTSSVDAGVVARQQHSEAQANHHVRQESRRRVRVSAPTRDKVAGAAGSRGSNGSSRGAGSRHTSGPILFDDSGPLSPQTAMPLVAAQLQ